MANDQINYRRRLLVSRSGMCIAEPIDDRVLRVYFDPPQDEDFVKSIRSAEIGGRPAGRIVARIEIDAFIERGWTAHRPVVDGFSPCPGRLLEVDREPGIWLYHYKKPCGVVLSPRWEIDDNPHCYAQLQGAFPFNEIELVEEPIETAFQMS